MQLHFSVNGTALGIKKSTIAKTQNSSKQNPYSIVYQRINLHSFVMDEDQKKAEFCIPTKEVKSVADLLRWEKSEGYQVYSIYVKNSKLYL